MQKLLDGANGFAKQCWHVDGVCRARAYKYSVAERQTSQKDAITRLEKPKRRIRECTQGAS